MTVFPFLFSGGQDSLLAFLLICLKQNKNNSLLLTINHESQVNSASAVFHLLKLAGSFQETIVFSSFSFLFQTENDLTEETFRKARYQLTLRFQNFSTFWFSVTNHTLSDSIETVTFNFLTRNTEVLDTASLKEQKIGQKFYHQCVPNPKIVRTKSFRSSLNKKNVQKKINFGGVKISLNQVQRVAIYRPIKTISRTSLLIFSKTRNLPVFIDQTNFSSSFTRNRFRRHLLVYVQEFLNNTIESSYKFEENSLLLREVKKTWVNDFRSVYFYYFNTKIICLQKTEFEEFLNDQDQFIFFFLYLTKKTKNLQLFDKKASYKILVKTKNYISFCR